MEIMAKATASHEESLAVTSSDQTDNNLEQDTKIFSTFGFDVKTQKTDLTLIFGKHRLYVKKSVLEDASPVLENLIEENLSGETDRELAIDDTSCEDFAELLACIQPRGRRKITTENVYRMLEMACKYEVDDVKERCEECLLEKLGESLLDPDFIVRHLDIAIKNGLASLQEKCMINTNLKTLEVLREDKTVSLPLSKKCELYEKFLPDLLSKSYILDCLRMSLPNAILTKLEGFKNAKAFKIECEIPSFLVFKQMFNLWGIKWNVQIGSSCWNIYLKNDPDINRDFTMKVGIAVRIKNHIPLKEDRVVIDIFSFSSESKDGLVWSNYQRKISN